MSDIRRFHIETSDAQLDDLRTRLAMTRWAEPEPVGDWSQGIPRDYLEGICDYWANGYDWPARQARINRFPQFLTEIDGVDIHFIHQRSPRKDAVPLIMTHGWPGSIVEFLEVIGPLSDPEAHGASGAPAFHVVCPTLPGFGYSGKPTQTGWGVMKIASAWNTLMARLGYDRYYAQGGDWGGAVTAALGGGFAGSCLGIHTNFPVTPLGPAEGETMTEEEQACMAGLQTYQAWDSSYLEQQSTRPQTIGYALVDSPVGLAGWILEKYRAWTHRDGNPEHLLTRDELLDNLMLYWLPAAGASSARLYWESGRQLLQALGGELNDVPGFMVEVPSGISRFPVEIVKPSRRWAERRYRNLQYWNVLEQGGHFAAFEVPELFVNELRHCFGPMIGASPEGRA